MLINKVLVAFLKAKAKNVVPVPPVNNFRICRARMPSHGMRAMPAGANPAPHSANLLCIHTGTNLQQRDVQNTTRLGISGRCCEIDKKQV